ncbi:MAG: hypothetical protein DRP84_07105 [Spirochaetes bacterium]|nr:MAG: hypothetical protein DRP84_07105 [Spirochaetota bacterium]
MRIAQVISDYFPNIGGAQVCIHHVATRLSERGHKVFVITPSSVSSLKFRYFIIQMSPIFLKVMYKNVRLGSLLLKQYASALQKKYKFDMWQINIGYPLGIGLIEFLLKNKIPCVLRCSGEDIQMFDGEIRYGYRLDPRVDKLIREKYPLFDVLVAISKTVKNEYLKLGIPLEKIVEIPNGVDIERFTERKKYPREVILNYFRLPQNVKILLTVGRNHPKKGYTLIPNIAESLFKECKNFVWIVVGKGVSKVNYQNLSSYIKNRLIFLDTAPKIFNNNRNSFSEFPDENLIAFYLNADVFVFTSFIETFGIVLIEAMAAGLPIVAFDVEGVRDVVKDRENGFLIPRGDIDIYASKIKELLCNSNLYATIKKRNVLKARQLSWDRITSKYVEVYENLIDRQRLHRREGTVNEN